MWRSLNESWQNNETEDKETRKHIRQRLWINNLVEVCVFALKSSFYSSTSSTPSVRADSSSEIQAPCPQNYDTGSYVVPGRQQ